MLANDSYVLDLTAFIDIIENKPSKTVLDYGIKIVSTSEIMVYYEVSPSCNCNPDIFALKGSNALGNSFITPYQSFNNSWSGYYAGFNIVASEDDTEVSIVLTQDSEGIIAGEEFSVNLDKGQTYSIKVSNNVGSESLSGTTINSNKNISVTIHEDSLSGPYGGCGDLVGDQLIPIELLGHEYIAIKGYLYGPDKVYVTAQNNNTSVQVDGVQFTTLDALETVEITLSNSSVYIYTSEPTYVLHMSGFGCEVGQAILPPLDCTGSYDVSVVRSTSEFFALNILAPAGSENDFYIEGSILTIDANDFNYVPGSNQNWIYAQLDFTDLINVNDVIRVLNSDSRFHMGLIHGGSTSGCRYGYFSDFAEFDSSFTAQNPSCEGDSIEFQGPFIQDAIYSWNGPDGFTSDIQNPVIENITLANQGEYSLEIIVNEVCTSTSSMEIEIIPAPSITDPISDYQLCDNDGDGSETFDLTSKYDEIVNTLTDITLTYYNTEADANADTNAIATPDSYNSEGTETIWISALNLEGCTTVGSFNLVIDTVPLFTEVPLFQICDDTTPDGFTEFDLDSLYSTIVAGAPNLIVSYYLTEVDAEAGTVSPLSSPYTNTINPELIWARVEDDIAGCYGIFVIELNVISLIAGAPTPLFECDQTPNDGIADFNLIEADIEIINGQTNNFVTYHETLAQAEAGTDALVSPYTNTVPNTQTIFARLEEEVLRCYDVTQLVLQVDPTPSITDPISDYQLCDNDGDGSETFDLTSKYDEIVNTLTDITLTYYNTEADANADTNAIAIPFAYISSGLETIWVRLSNSFTQCYTIGSFQIETIFCPLPDATVSINNDLYACRNRDLIVEYRVNNIEGTAIIPAFTPISFYLDEILVTQTQTLNDIPINGSETNSIEINLPPNTPNLFEILIRVDDLGFSEGIIEELNELNNEYSVLIEFGSIPPILPLSNLIECDEGNESSNFNLTQQNNSISTNINDIITFYISEEDANLNENEITDVGNYQNTSNPQAIFIRFENEICFTISSFEIEIENCTPFIPEGFSPNNDNINDFFEIDHLLNVYLDFELKIFSRFGNLIYKGTHKDGFWDGISNEGITFKHQLVPTGVYFYVLHLNDPQYPNQFIGNVYINY